MPMAPMPHIIGMLHTALNDPFGFLRVALQAAVLLGGFIGTLLFAHASKGIYGVLTLAIVVALSGCGESNDEAYNRGIHDGWAQTCNEIAAFSSSIESRLKSKGIC